MDGNQGANTSIVFGEKFLEALAARDFDRMQTLFSDAIRFRALLPSNIREANRPAEAIAWYRSWFEEPDHFDMQVSSVDQMADRLSLNYRIRLHDEDGWQVVEQKAFCKVQAGHIQDMALVCSGFRPEQVASQAVQAAHG